MATELEIMYHALLALVSSSTDIGPLIEEDLALELKKNSQLRSSAEGQQRFRQDYRQTIQHRIMLLRRNVFRSFILLVTATVIALLISYYVGRFAPAWIGIASMFLLGWSTVARLGYGGASWGADTVIERLDQRIFKTLFWLGTFFGILALASGA